MITEDYVSFETAKLLKEKGFDELTELSYELSTGYSKKVPCRNTLDTEYVSKITLQMAMKWLREEHNLTVDVFHFRNWKINIKTIPDDYMKALYDILPQTDTYEEACEEGIKYCLRNLL